MILFNKNAEFEKRKNVLNLSLSDQEKVIEIINNKSFSTDEIELIQKFVYYFENLQHHSAITGGIFNNNYNEMI